MVTLAERFGGSRAEGFQFEAMVEFVQAKLKPFSEANGIGAKVAHAARIFSAPRAPSPPSRASISAFPNIIAPRSTAAGSRPSSIRDVTKRIAAMNWEQRAAQPCIGAERADLILAGCAIMEAMLRVWPVRSLRVADRGLREGILATLIAEDAMRERASLERERNGQTETRRIGAIS